MTDKEFKKLSKFELLELMLAMRTELERLGEENESLKRKLEDQSSFQNEILKLAADSASGVKLLCEQAGLEISTHSEVGELEAE